MSRRFVPLWIVLALASGSAMAAPRCPPADLFKQPSLILEGKLAFCDKDCWVLDAAGAWSSRPVVGLQAAEEAGITIDDKGIKVCAADGACTTIATPAYKEGGRGIANADRSLVAVMAGSTVDVFDVAKAKKLATIKAWKTPMGAFIGSARFLGDTLAVWANYTPVSSIARLFTARTGKLIGNVGKRDTQIEETAAHLDGTRWLFAGFEPAAYVVDVATAKTVKTFALPGTPSGRNIVGTLADGRVVMIYDDVHLIDVAAGKTSVLAAPTCPKSP